MNRTAFIKGMQAKKRKRTPARKPNIRWELLGLSAPDEGKEPVSIESIRQAVSSMASRGLGQGARSRTKAVESEDVRQVGARRVGRRGATE
ncbi:MAG: hypothetical protein NNA19_09635 [Nitrospira sp.]|nr:hypothetical protein [Nitrospira sp.]MCP9475489.1 hypothetical protein [Nitrospira sp.]